MTTKLVPIKRLSRRNFSLPIIRLGVCFGVVAVLAWNLLSAKAGPVVALEFDGMDDVVEIPSRPVLGDTFTEEAWILPSPKDDRYHGIVGYPSTNVTHRAPGLWITHRTAVHAGFGDGKNWIAFSSKEDAIVLNMWNHVAASYDGSTYRIYANGEEVVAQPLKKIPLRQPVRRIGRVDYWFPGAIRDVRLWNRALSGDEIRRQMNKPLTGQEEGLVGYFPLDDGEGLQARNGVRGGGEGTLLYGPKWIASSAPIAPAALKSQAMATGPGAVEHFSPSGENVAPDADVEIILHKGAGAVEPESIRLTFDKKLVEAVVSTNEAGGLTVRYETGTLLDGASKHTVDLSDIVNGKSETNQFSYNFSITPNVILSK